MNVFCVGKPPKYKLGQWISTIVVSFCFFTSGMAMAWTSPAFLKVDRGEVALKLSHMEMGVLAAVPFLGRVLSPIPSGYAMDALGRRGCLVLGRLLQLVHWVLMYCTYNIWVLYFARFLSGWYSGLGAFITGVYVGETAHKKIRGQTQAFLSVNFLLGAVFISIIGPLVDYDLLIIIPGVVDFVTFVFMFAIPETPYYYLQKQRRQEAEKALSWCRGTEDVTRELDRIERYLNRQLDHGTSYGFIFTRTATRKAFLTVLILLILQRSSGIVAVISFASFITPHTDWLPQDKGPIVLMVTYLIVGLLTSFIIDKFNRKSLLLFSTLGSSVFILGLTIWYFFEYTEYVDTSDTEWIPIVMLILQAAFYSTGFAIIPALLMSEMFPMNVKAKASALVAVIATLFSMTIVFIFLPLTKSFGVYTNFIIYFLANLCAAIYSTTILETRGKTLETIQSHLEGRFNSNSSISQFQRQPTPPPDAEEEP